MYRVCWDGSGVESETRWRSMTTSDHSYVMGGNVYAGRIPRDLSVRTSTWQQWTLTQQHDLY